MVLGLFCQRGIAPLSSVWLLAGCVYVSDVIPWGSGTCVVESRVAGNPTKSWTEIKALAVKRADAYCRERGKGMDSWETLRPVEPMVGLPWWLRSDSSASAN